MIKTTLFADDEERGGDGTEVVTFRIPAKLAITISSSIAAAQRKESVNQFVRRVFFWGMLLHSSHQQAPSQNAILLKNEFADMNGVKPVADMSKSGRPIPTQRTRQSFRDIAREAVPH